MKFGVVCAGCIVSAYSSTQRVQYGTFAIARTTFADMFAPVVTIEGPKGYLSVFNSSFVRIAESNDSEGPNDRSIVADPLATNAIWGDSMAANDILIPIKPYNARPAGLFLQEDDRLYTQIRAV